MNKLTLSYLLILFLFFSCNSPEYNEPVVSLEAYKIKDGFNLEVITSEPFIEAPVVMDFDNQGRIWVVEMRGYMQNLEGTGEDMPNGRITILEDLDKDGITDHAKIFLDSLVLPRAIAHVYGGLLYAEPPNLWFVDIKDDKPMNKVLVDSKYTHGGNVEHQPNGLMLHLDNWIYNAKSWVRYQRKAGVWIKENTSFRGQWGITKDNFGRIYFNDNSTQLNGDLVLPNTTTKNKFLKPLKSTGKNLTKTRSVYPLHPTSVNRGYLPGVLDKDSILTKITSACGPLIYRGNQFAKEFSENAFICAPEANLIKRNIIDFTSYNLTAKQATPKTEFIASTDEGFRPVNLFNGPDGNLYIVDMHRGILQDKAFLTPYLKKHYAKKKLDTIIGMGRILKVSPNDHTFNEIPNFKKLNDSELIQLLAHDNGWHRDRAQHTLVFQYRQTAIPLLKNKLESSTSAITKIHILHTLNGLEALTYDYLFDILSKSDDEKILSHVLVLLENFADQKHAFDYSNRIKKLLKKHNPFLDIYISNSMGQWLENSKKTFLPILKELKNRHSSKTIHLEGVVSSLRNNEEEFLSTLDVNKDALLVSLLSKTIQNKTEQQTKAEKKNKSNLQKSINHGKEIFKNICATCHGINGEGIDGLAPPLQKSEYISESTERLALVLLHGLSGPIHVNGKLYNLSATMPGLNNNPDYTDEEILNLINYLQSEFSKNHKIIKTSIIKSLRKEKPKSGVYTEEELLLIK